MTNVPRTMCVVQHYAVSALVAVPEPDQVMMT